MNDRADGALAALERRLARQRPLPPALRPRVLAAVNELLHNGGYRRESTVDYRTPIPFAAGAAIAVALSLLLALILPQSAMDARFQPASPWALFSLVERVRAADIEFDLAPTHAAQLAGGLPITPPDAGPVHVLRSIDSRCLLEGEL